MKLFGKLFKYTILSVSFLIFAFFIFRLAFSGTPKELRRIVWTPQAIEAYRSSPETFEAIEQEQETYITNDGKFWILDVVYLPEAKQLQMVIKYNDSTLKYLKEALGTETLPEEPFVYSLLDNNGARYETHTQETGRRLNYNYRLLAFENIDLTDISVMYVDIYYTDAVDYEKAPYSSLMTWNRALPTVKRNVRKELPEELKDR